MTMHVNDQRVSASVCAHVMSGERVDQDRKKARLEQQAYDQNGKLTRAMTGVPVPVPGLNCPHSHWNRFYCQYVWS